MANPELITQVLSRELWDLMGISENWNPNCCCVAFFERGFIQKTENHCLVILFLQCFFNRECLSKKQSDIYNETGMTTI